MFVFICVYIYIYVYVHVCMCIHIYTRIYLYTYAYVYIYTCIYTNICMYMCICVHVYIYIYVNVFVHMSLFTSIWFLNMTIWLVFPLMTEVTDLFPFDQQRKFFCGRGWLLLLLQEADQYSYCIIYLLKSDWIRSLNTDWREILFIEYANIRDFRLHRRTGMTDSFSRHLVSAWCIQSGDAWDYWRSFLKKEGSVATRCQHQRKIAYGAATICRLL